MKDYIKLIIFLLIIILSTIVCYKLVHINDRRNNARKQSGIYQLDVKNTKLGVYNKDSVLYKNLTIELKEDMTFKMNFSVPFIFDSSGTWIARTNEFEDWNWMYFNRRNNGYIMDCQFSVILENNPSLIMNSNTPKKGEEVVSVIIFKKI